MPWRNPTQVCPFPRDTLHLLLLPTAAQGREGGGITEPSTLPAQALPWAGQEETPSSSRAERTSWPCRPQEGLVLQQPLTLCPEQPPAEQHSHLQ